MSRKRQNVGLLGCVTKNLDGECGVSINSPSNNSSFKSDQQNHTDARSNIIDAYTCDNETLKHNAKMHSTASIFGGTSNADSSTSSRIGTAFRLCLTFVVITVFTVWISQVQNVEGNRSNTKLDIDGMLYQSLMKWMNLR
jgi:hypothetical protein